MKLSTFEKLARTVATRAATYPSKRACDLALARVRAAWRASGSYGNISHLLGAATAAIQDRWAELHTEERNTLLIDLGLMDEQGRMLDVFTGEFQEASGST